MERYRFHADGSVFFVTFSIVEWLPLFVSERACKIVTESFNFCHRQKGLRINAYVIMPTHLHAIVFHETFDASPLETTLVDFRKYTGRQLCEFADSHSPGCFSTTMQNCAGEDRKRRCWQPSRHPVQIETESFWRTKFDYLHDNPRRKGFVQRPEYWRFSSASHWADGPDVHNDVVLTALEW